MLKSTQFDGLSIFLKEGILGIHRKPKLNEFLKSTVISVLLHNKKDDEDTEIRMKLDDRVDLTFFSHVNSEQARMDNRAIFPCVFFTFQAVSHCSDFNMKKNTTNKRQLETGKDGLRR